MKKEEIVSEVGRPLLRPLGFIQGAFILLFMSSPFVWVWYSGILAFKVGITGFIGALFIYGIYSLVEKVVSESVDEYLKNPDMPTVKSGFQKRMEEYKNKVRG